MKYKLLLLSLFSFSFINAQVTADAGPDRQICIMDTLKVAGDGLTPGDTGSYQWKDLNSNSVISNKKELNIKITQQTSRKYELTVTRISNNITYTDKDSFVLTVSPLPTFKFAGLAPRCYLDGRINLTFNTIAIAIQGNDTSKKFYDIRYFQKFKKPSWISGGPVGSNPYFYDFPKFITNAQVPSTGLKDTICYEYKDANGCYDSECKPVRINPNPDVQVVDGLYCQKAGKIDLDKLVLKPLNKAGGLQSWRCIEVPAGSGVNPDSIITQLPTSPVTFRMDPGLQGENQKTGVYYLEYCFKNPTTSCQRCDTATINVIRLPEIEIDNIPNQCINGSLLTLDSFVRDKYTGKRLAITSWQCVAYGGSRDLTKSNVKNAINNGVKSQKYFDPETDPNGGQYTLKVTDVSSGCPMSDSTVINVNGLPQIKLPAQDSFCANSGKYQLYSNYAINDSNGKWSGEYVTNGKLNSDTVVMGSAYSKTTKGKFTYTNPLTKCTNTDSVYFTFIKRPYFKFVQVVKQNSRFLVSFSLIDSNMMMNNFKWSWNFGNGATGNNKYPKDILYMDSGNYKAILTIDNGVCETRDSISFLLNNKTSSIPDISKLINIYPNPVNTELFIDIPFDGVISLIDMNGKQLLQDQVISNETKSLSMDLLAPGMYMLIFRNDMIHYHVKLIKE